MKIFNQRKNILMYTIDQGKYNNNLSISVQNGEVVVCAPWYFTRNQIQKVVEEKSRWILSKIQKDENKIDNIVRTVCVFGKDYPVYISFKNIKRPELNLENEKININLPNKYKKKDINNILNIILRKMYYSISEKKIEEVMEKTRIKLGFAPEDYKIRSLDNVLAKCENMSKIIINPEIMKFDQNIIEFIIMHEFCHLKYKTHSKNFVKIMKENLFGYEMYKKELENIGYNF